MKKLTGAAAFLAGAVLAFQSAQAQSPNSFVPNDLYLGFQNNAGGGTADYIVNLGPVSAFINNPAGMDFSSYLSLADFQSAGLQGANSGATIMAGIVGGANSGNPSDLYLTQLRSGGAGNQAVPGSSMSVKSGVVTDNALFADMSQITAPAVGTGVLDSGLSWEKYIEPANSAGTFLGDSGLNPDSPVGSGALYEDLWSSSSSGGLQPFVYDGYFTLNLTSDSLTLAFTPVPEPSNYLISGAGGILMLLLRFRLSRRNT
jgi:hypothetical protein